MIWSQEFIQNIELLVLPTVERYLALPTGSVERGARPTDLHKGGDGIERLAACLKSEALSIHFASYFIARDFPTLVSKDFPPSYHTLNFCRDYFLELCRSVIGHIRNICTYNRLPLQLTLDERASFGMPLPNVGTCYWHTLINDSRVFFRFDMSASDSTLAAFLKPKDLEPGKTLEFFDPL